MALKEIFHKPVDRNIEGVIKADDDASLWLELDEYVITNEVEKRLEAFLDAYNNYAGANGVWISGFLALVNLICSKCWRYCLKIGRLRI